MQTVELEEPVEVEEKIVTNQVCDGCGASVPAAYEAKKDDYILYFCGHHIRKLADNLKSDGFEISPEDFSFTANI